MGLLAATFAMSEILEQSNGSEVGQYYHNLQSSHTWDEDEEEDEEDQEQDAEEVQSAVLLNSPHACFT